MKRYPVYYMGKKVALWDAMEESLWTILKPHIREDQNRSDFLPIFDGDKVIIVLKRAGEGG